MNRLARIEDIPAEEIRTAKYDLAVFGSGHECRAGHLAKDLDPARIGNVIVLGFEGGRAEPTRIENDELYRSRWGRDPEVLATRDESSIYKLLEDAIGGASHCRVLIDYSSMTRYWYAAALNWFRFSERVGAVTADFVYCGGRYVAEIPALQIEEIVAVPGCEGNTAAAGLSVAVVGLGFDSNAVQCVLDDLEPDLIKSFMARGQTRVEYDDLVLRANAELITRCGEEPVALPLGSVARTLACLGELVSPYDVRHNVSVIPLGPKPHVLASVLLSMQLQHVAALHVSGVRHPAWNVLPTDLIVGTRVMFVPERFGVRQANLA